jgi:hypothetical protein
MGFHIHVNIAEAASKLNQTTDLIGTQITQAVGQVAAGTHAFILQKAKAELTGYKKFAYLGYKDENVRWVDLGNGMWVVEVDEKARWLEEGRDRVFMEWLLKNAKTAKDGSKYKVIPMPQDKGPLPLKKGADLSKVGSPWTQKDSPLATVTKRLLAANNVSLGSEAIQRGPDKKPLTGIVQHINLGREEVNADVRTQDNGNRRDYFSMPRSADMAGKIGLKPHEGIFMLKGMVITQTANEETAQSPHGVRREAITYRVISSKHQQEGRWFYPKVEAFNAVPEAAEWAQKELDKWMKDFERSFTDIQGT